MNHRAWLEDPALTELLREGELEVEGRLGDASNTTLRCLVETPGATPLRCVFKPVAGERPLWDFPHWTLTHREIAAHALSAALGWNVVPPTVWRDDGPGGAGMCQLWIDEDPAQHQVGVVRPASAPPGWLEVLDAEDGAGNPVVLVHSASPALQRMAVFDALVNNADRKGGHVLTDADGCVWGIDHGVTFAVEAKLRTVLWGWAGEPIDTSILEDVAQLHERLAGSFDPVDRWLAEDERDALRHRVRATLRDGSYPEPSGAWPAIPWPVF